MADLDFTSAPEDGEEEVEQIDVPFRLDGQEFRSVLRIDGDAVLEWSELAAAASLEDDMTSVRGIAFTSRFFRLMMPGDQYAALRAHMKAWHTPPDRLLKIMRGLNAAMEEELAKSTARPTRRSSPSSPGREVKDDRMLKIISLSEADGEVEFVPLPGRQVTRRQQPRGKRRRRAG
jgi:hypothetical protein